jgi:hypothetical protein
MPGLVPGIQALPRTKKDVVAGTSAKPRFALCPATTERKVVDELYTDAVVTPPSMTMVWPVMKVDESEPR